MSFFKDFDWWLFFLIILILCLGAVTILSVNRPLFSTELIFILISLIAFFLVSKIDLGILEGFNRLFYLFTLILLVLPYFIGIFSRGAIRWLQVGPFRFQPSEFAKFLLLIYFARFWAERKYSLKNLLVCLLFLIPPAVLIFLQPDLGSSLVVVILVAGMVIGSGISWSQIIGLFLLFLLTLPMGWNFLKDYQKLRIIHFINPSQDPLGSGYNVLQAIITIGAGGLLGKGLGKGTQSHLAFLPERHTDFIFASFAEEFGWLGSVILLFLYWLLLKRILKIAFQAKSLFGYYLCLGIFFFISFQTMVNIGMNLGVMPITGITLPLLSSGGSSLLSTLICLGVVESVSRSGKKGAAIEIG